MIFFVDENVDEFDLILQENKKRCSKKLMFTIMVSGNCNFGYNYCGQNHKNVNLSRENQDRLIKRISEKLNAKKFDTLDIAWFGGEPFIATDVIEYMSEKFIEICAKENIKYNPIITTNASLLSEELAKKYVEQFHIKEFCITIDGNEEEHNCRRCLKGGGGSFFVVYKNFKNLLEVVNNDLKVEIDLRCNIDVRNPDAIFNFIKILHEDNLEKYKNLHIYLAPIHDWGNNAGDNAFEQKKFAEIEIQAYSKLIELGFTVKPLPKRKYGCLFTNEDGEMSDPYGNLFPCSEVGLVDSYIIDGKNKYQIGTLKDGITSDRNIFPKFKNFSDINSPCRKCKIFPTCIGSYPKQWEDNNLPCPTARYNLKEKCY